MQLLMEYVLYQYGPYIYVYMHGKSLSSLFICFQRGCSQDHAKRKEKIYILFVMFVLENKEYKSYGVLVHDQSIHSSWH